MQHITRLIIKARKATGGENMTVVGFIDYDHTKQKYTCSGYVWNGVPGSVSDKDSFYSEHDTAEEATAAAEAIAAKYPGCENINFIMNCV